MTKQTTIMCNLVNEIRKTESSNSTNTNQSNKVEAKIILNATRQLKSEINSKIK